MTPTLEVDVLTIFPHMFPGPLGDSITGRALEAGLVRLDAVDIRDVCYRSAPVDG